MKTSITGLLQGRIPRWSVCVGLGALLLLGGAAIAGVKQALTAKVYNYGGEPGAWSITPSGNIHIDGMTSLNRVESDNPLFAGQLTWVGNLELDPTYCGVGAGTGVLTLGTWDGVNFTPSGGVWVTKWEVQGCLIGEYVGKVVGHGVAGEVEGMQFVVEFVGAGDHDDYAGEILDPHAQK